MNKNDIILPILIAFAISAIITPIIIPFLKKLKFGQFVRDEGPKSHLKKAGTPTMGGLIFIISIAITSLIYVKEYPQIIPILIATVGFGMIGFIDDYIKVVLKRSMGLKAAQKMLGQILVTAAFAFYLYAKTDIGTEIMIPFVEKTIDLGWVYYPILFFVVLGTVNGANFTDGIDGLATSVTIIIATFFSVAAIGLSSGVATITGATVGALLGFLLYNTYPAKVFMGDTGSLALGGFVASTAFVLQMPLIILIVAFIYFVEVLSVIIQVAVFKKTGKRVFKMAPIHHHFEMCDWPESKVVSIFTIVTVVLCVIGILAI